MNTLTPEIWRRINELAAVGMAVERYGRLSVVEVVDSPEPGRIYDFADSYTDAWGQCSLDAEGNWKESKGLNPRGHSPVILRTAKDPVRRGK